MKRIIEQYPFFLILLPAFVVIHLEKELHGLIRYSLIYDRIIFLFAAPVLFFLIFYLFSRSVRKSSLLSFAGMLIFYYTGDLKNWLSHKLPETIWHSYIFLMPVFLLILVTLFYTLKKKKFDFRNAFLILNTTLLLFISADIIQLFFAGTKDKYKIISDPETDISACDSCTNPDIYYIIFDAYAAHRQLQAEFGFSNHRIEEELKNKGFIIIPGSRSNYSYTSFSIGSTLNMNYIRNVDTVDKIFTREYMRALKLVYENRVFSFFQNQNYSIFNHSPFNIKSYPTKTIQNFDFWGIPELFDQYNLATKINRDIGYHFPDWMKNIFSEKHFVNGPKNKDLMDSIAYEHLMQTIKLKSNRPKFIYAHFFTPHPPYYFDSTRQLFKTISTLRERYLHQIAYSNKLIKKITDSIMAYTQRPLVIIIQGDHGISFNDPVNPQDYFPNFNAIYFSTKDYRLISDTMSNVNTFRIVLNTFFKKDMKLLPYQSGFFRW
jgi:hypothetical protein